MKRTRIDLHQVAAYPHLASAAARAARGKRTRPEVVAFFARFDQNLVRLRRQLLVHKAPFGHYRRFVIRDPKCRIIHAACFADRVLHHALVHFLEPVIERALLPTVYACRRGKGNLGAVKQVQNYMRRYPWFVKIDIQKYFDTIDHDRLYEKLAARFKGRDALLLIRKIIDGYQVTPGKGLPIGSLTSQYFANYYLNNFDRWLFSSTGVRGMVRYMDDIVWWLPDREAARESLQQAKAYLAGENKLVVKDNGYFNRSPAGITFCGFRIFPGALKLTARRKKRYIERKRAWEKAYKDGLIDAGQLQNAFAAVHAAISHADSLQWRKKVLAAEQAIDI